MLLNDLELQTSRFQVKRTEVEFNISVSREDAVGRGYNDSLWQEDSVVVYCNHSGYDTADDQPTSQQLTNNLESEMDILSYSPTIYILQLPTRQYYSRLNINPQPWNWEWQGCFDYFVPEKKTM